MNHIAERRAEEREQRRSDILDAAEEIAAKTGIDRLTMDQVARRARLSRALLYVYFKDKSELHLGICERGLSRLFERIEQTVPRHKLGLDQIVALGRAYVAFAQEFPVYFATMARFEAAESELNAADRPAASCKQASERLHRTMIGAIEVGQRDGSISKEAGPSNVTAMTLWGFIHGITQLAHTKGHVLSGYGLSAKELVDQGIALARRGVAGNSGP
jgi:AcrR family transcriptional regulator